MEKKYLPLTIHLENVSQAQAIALVKMFKYMQHLGQMGSSRTCSFFADGDGDFRPKFKSFEYPELLPPVNEVTGIKPNGDFSIDFDSISWKIYHDPIDTSKPFEIGGPVGVTTTEGKEVTTHTVVTEKGAQLLGVKDSLYSEKKDQDGRCIINESSSSPEQPLERTSSGRNSSTEDSNPRSA